MRANVAAFVPQVMLKTNLFFCCSRRVCGREVVTFWRARKEPKSAQRGLKRVQVWTSAPSGLSPPLPFLAGKSSGGCPACRHFPCAVFRVENTKFALVCAKRDSGTGTHAFSRLFAVLCILRQRFCGIVRLILRRDPVKAAPVRLIRFQRHTVLGEQLLHR